LTFSTALIDSGAAQLLADAFINVFRAFGNFGIIVGVYLVTLILTSFVTHVAAVSIVFPIAYAIAMQVPGMNSIAIFIAIAFAASASFHSPFSYQTNMMVYGPGGYKFKDFLKVGLPLTLIYSILTLTFIGLYYNL
jgi:di/tricarboxylate transporter